MVELKHEVIKWLNKNQPSYDLKLNTIANIKNWPAAYLYVAQQKYLSPKEILNHLSDEYVKTKKII